MSDLRNRDDYDENVWDFNFWQCEREKFFPRQKPSFVRPVRVASKHKNTEPRGESVMQKRSMFCNYINQ